MNTKSKIIFSNKIPKELDLAQSFMLELDEDGLVVLSAVNVAKVEAMIKTDSAYSGHSDRNNNKSSAFLFEKLKSEILNSSLSDRLEQTSKDTIFNIICTLDVENGTRLSTDGVGKKKSQIEFLTYQLRNF